MSQHHEILIVGGGTAGITVAAQLANLPDAPSVGILEPSDKHHYQPIWTLVGGGVFPREVSQREQRDFIPAGVEWHMDAASSFDPDNNTVTTDGGKELTYDQLIVAMGIQIDWSAIKGLKDGLGRDGICSNYSYESVQSTWENIRGFRGGRALFTQPGTPIKCAGAPQKIMYLAEHHFRRAGIRDACTVSFFGAVGRIFGVDKYAAALERIIDERSIDTNFFEDLTEVRPRTREAVFRNTATDSESVVKYDMIHVTPPMSAPDILKRSPLGDDAGWVDVDAHTLQHTCYPNVFALGDCSSLPTSKTGAAVRQQAPIVVANVIAYRQGHALDRGYDGYTSCPLVTGYGSLILAEFDYDKQPAESFPFDQSQERYSMYALKAYGLPRLYWHGMLRGRA